jgi:transglutaminase-like putative cysteine protease
LSPPLRQPAAATAGATPSAAGRAEVRLGARAEVDWAPWLRLIAFIGLALFGAGHWASLVAGPSPGRTLLVVLVAAAGAALLIGLGVAPVRSRLQTALGDRPRAAAALIAAAAVLIGLATITLGLVAAGLPLRLLGPENWGELGDGLDRGLAGVQGVDWPYDGPDEWIRRTILLGAPFLLGIAATLAFFPARRAAPVLHAAALAALLVLYGTAVTEHDPGQPLLRGLALLLLVGAWLWLPRLRPREATAAAVAVLVVGLLSLPVAAALDGPRPWWDYHAWNWFGGGKAITFDWTHEYGPLDWPRDGTTLLNVRSDRPHYWKAETLDSFDGLRWVRSGQNDRGDLFAELPDNFGQPMGRSWELFEYNPAWDEDIEVTVRSLTSDLIVGAGTIHGVDGVADIISGDGTARVQGDPLEKGDAYTVRAYAPDPDRAQMRAASDGRFGYPGDLVQYTSVYLPTRSDDATQGTGRAGDAARSARLALRRPVFIPLAGEALSGDDTAHATLRRSRYGEMYRLALDWTEGAPTGYDRVKAIERNLQRDYVYAERVPTRPLPLNGFLFDDRRGYCQQFSGTMALMLRMLGIPARVAAGFSPGSYNRDSNEYRVRDLDAHSWVEVYFTGIGWVPFDPTPAAAPAESQSAAAATSAASGDAGEVANPRGGVAAERVDAPGAGLGTGEDGSGWVVPVLVLLAALPMAGALWYGVRRVRVQRRLTGEQLAQAQLAELRRALERLDWNVPAATTLLALERRLLRAAGPESAGYARRLREHRYDPRAPRAPGPSERRALRRELSARGGLLARLRGLFAIPPGGPRPV